MLASTMDSLYIKNKLYNSCMNFCGYTMGEADIVRRHFAKKDRH